MASAVGERYLFPLSEEILSLEKKDKVQLSRIFGNSLQNIFRGEKKVYDKDDAVIYCPEIFEAGISTAFISGSCPGDGLFCLCYFSCHIEASKIG